MGPQEEYIETVITCEGDFYDPEFHAHLHDFSKRLQDLLITGQRELVVKKVEPWNSVRVTFNIPREAAVRLKQLAETGDQTLRELGVLAVQVEGDRLISLTIAGKNNERTELVLHTTDSVAGASSSVYDMQSSDDLAVPGPSNVETTRRNIAQYLQGEAAFKNFLNTADNLKPPDSVGAALAAASAQDVLAKVHHPLLGKIPFSMPGVGPGHLPVGLDQFPFSHGPMPNCFPSPSTARTHTFSSPSTSHNQNPLSPNYPTPPPSVSNPSSPGLRTPNFPVSLAGTNSAILNNLPRLLGSRDITSSSPLLVNLLQNDVGFGHLNNIMPNKLSGMTFPPLEAGPPPPKKRRKPRKPKEGSSKATKVPAGQEPASGMAVAPGISGTSQLTGPIDDSQHVAPPAAGPSLAEPQPMDHTSGQHLTLSQEPVSRASSTSQRNFGSSNTPFSDPVVTLPQVNSPVRLQSPSRSTQSTVKAQSPRAHSPVRAQSPGRGQSPGRTKSPGSFILGRGNNPQHIVNPVTGQLEPAPSLEAGRSRMFKDGSVDSDDMAQTQLKPPPNPLVVLQKNIAASTDSMSVPSTSSTSPRQPSPLPVVTAREASLSLVQGPYSKGGVEHTTRPVSSGIASIPAIPIPSTGHNNNRSVSSCVGFGSSQPVVTSGISIPLVCGSGLVSMSTVVSRAGSEVGVSGYLTLSSASSTSIVPSVMSSMSGRDVSMSTHLTQSSCVSTLSTASPTNSPHIRGVVMSYAPSLPLGIQTHTGTVVNTTMAINPTGSVAQLAPENKTSMENKVISSVANTGAVFMGPSHPVVNSVNSTAPIMAVTTCGPVMSVKPPTTKDSELPTSRVVVPASSSSSSSSAGTRDSPSRTITGESAQCVVGQPGPASFSTVSSANSVSDVQQYMSPSQDLTGNGSTESGSNNAVEPSSVRVAVDKQPTGQPSAAPVQHTKSLPESSPVPSACLDHSVGNRPILPNYAPPEALMSGEDSTSPVTNCTPNHTASVNTTPDHEPCVTDGSDTSSLVAHSQGKDSGIADIGGGHILTKLGYLDKGDDGHSDNPELGRSNGASTSEATASPLSETDTVSSGHLSQSPSIRSASVGLTNHDSELSNHSYDDHNCLVPNAHGGFMVDGTPKVVSAASDKSPLKESLSEATQSAKTELQRHVSAVTSASDGSVITVGYALSQNQPTINLSHSGLTDKSLPFLTKPSNSYHKENSSEGLKGFVLREHLQTAKGVVDAVKRSGKLDTGPKMVHSNLNNGDADNKDYLNWSKTLNLPPKLLGKSDFNPGGLQLCEDSSGTTVALGMTVSRNGVDVNLHSPGPHSDTSGMTTNPRLSTSDQSVDYNTVSGGVVATQKQSNHAHGISVALPNANSIKVQINSGLEKAFKHETHMERLKEDVQMDSINREPIVSGVKMVDERTCGEKDVNPTNTESAVMSSEERSFSVIHPMEITSPMSRASSTSPVLQEPTVSPSIRTSSNSPFLGRSSASPSPVTPSTSPLSTALSPLLGESTMSSSLGPRTPSPSLRRPTVSPSHAVLPSTPSLRIPHPEAKPTDDNLHGVGTVAVTGVCVSAVSSMSTSAGCLSQVSSAQATTLSGTRSSSVTVRPQPVLANTFGASMVTAVLTSTVPMGSALTVTSFSGIGTHSSSAMLLSTSIPMSTMAKPSVFAGTSSSRTDTLSATEHTQNQTTTHITPVTLFHTKSGQMQNNTHSSQQTPQPVWTSGSVACLGLGTEQASRLSGVTTHTSETSASEPAASTAVCRMSEAVRTTVCRISESTSAGCAPNICSSVQPRADHPQSIHLDIESQVLVSKTSVSVTSTTMNNLSVFGTVSESTKSLQAQPISNSLVSNCQQSAAMECTDTVSGSSHQGAAAAAGPPPALTDLASSVPTSSVVGIKMSIPPSDTNQVTSHRSHSPETTIKCVHTHGVTTTSSVEVVAAETTVLGVSEPSEGDRTVKDSLGTEHSHERSDCKSSRGISIMKPMYDREFEIEEELHNQVFTLENKVKKPEIHITETTTNPLSSVNIPKGKSQFTVAQILEEADKQRRSQAQLKQNTLLVHKLDSGKPELNVMNDAAVNVLQVRSSKNTLTLSNAITPVKTPISSLELPRNTGSHLASFVQKSLQTPSLYNATPHPITSPGFPLNLTESVQKVMNAIPRTDNTPPPSPKCNKVNTSLALSPSCVRPKSISPVHDLASTALLTPLSTTQPQPSETDLHTQDTETDLHTEDTETDLHMQAPETDQQKQVPETDLHKQAPETDLHTQAPETDQQKQALETDQQKQAPETDQQKQAPETDLHTQAPETEQQAPETDLQKQVPETDQQKQAPETDLHKQMPDTDLHKQATGTDLHTQAPETKKPSNLHPQAPEPSQETQAPGTSQQSQVPMIQSSETVEDQDNDKTSSSQEISFDHTWDVVSDSRTDGEDATATSCDEVKILPEDDIADKHQEEHCDETLGPVTPQICGNSGKSDDSTTIEVAPKNTKCEVADAGVTVQPLGKIPTEEEPEVLSSEHSYSARPLGSSSESPPKTLPYTAKVDLSQQNDSKPNEDKSVQGTFNKTQASPCKNMMESVPNLTHSTQSSPSKAVCETPNKADSVEQDQVKSADGQSKTSPTSSKLRVISPVSKISSSSVKDDGREGPRTLVIKIIGAHSASKETPTVKTVLKPDSKVSPSSVPQPLPAKESNVINLANLGKFQQVSEIENFSSSKYAVARGVKRKLSSPVENKASEFEAEGFQSVSTNKAESESELPQISHLPTEDLVAGNKRSSPSCDAMSETSSVEVPVTRASDAMSETGSVEVPVTRASDAMSETSSVEVPVTRASDAMSETSSVEVSVTRASDAMSETGSVDVPVTRASDAMSETGSVDVPVTRASDSMSETGSVDVPVTRTGQSTSTDRDSPVLRQTRMSTRNTSRRRNSPSDSSTDENSKLSVTTRGSKKRTLEDEDNVVPDKKVKMDVPSNVENFLTKLDEGDTNEIVQREGVGSLTTTSFYNKAPAKATTVTTLVKVNSSHGPVQHNPPGEDKNLGKSKKVVKCEENSSVTTAVKPDLPLKEETNSGKRNKVRVTPGIEEQEPDDGLGKNDVKDMIKDDSNTEDSKGKRTTRSSRTKDHCELPNAVQPKRRRSSRDHR